MPSQLRAGSKRVQIVVDAEEWDKAKSVLEELGAPRDMLSRLFNDFLKVTNVGFGRILERKREGKVVSLGELYGSLIDFMANEEAKGEKENNSR